MISTIVAIANNNAIGKDNDLLWRLPGDLKRFKEITSGHTILMGRKTFLSLPRVLPNRHHVILTRDINFKFDDPNVSIVHSIDEVLKKYLSCPQEVFVIGGGEIYSELLPYSEKLYLTKVHKDFHGDTFFPEIDYSKWEKIQESALLEENNLEYTFIDLKRVSK